MLQKEKLKALLMNKGFGVKGAEIAISAIWEYLQNERAKAIKEFADKIEKELEPTMKAFFYIGETLVEVSKSHITESRALDKIRDYLQGTISSRGQLNRMIYNLVKENGRNRQ